PVRTSNGLGIRTATRTTRNLGGVPVSLDVGETTDQIDGLGGFDTVTLSFNQAVRLLSVSFARVGTNVGLLNLNDDFTFIRNGTVVSTQDVPGGNASDTGTGTFNIPVASQIGNNFGFRASQAEDDFFISSVTVQRVPEPITMAGIAMGAGFGVILRRKYKKSTNASESMSS
ncbi:MAG: PEP-CTERM sorting domain-containing protein, partial [Trichormus sp.]